MHSKTSTPSSPARIWILGAGHFGQLAVRRLMLRHPHCEFTVVDRREDRLEALRSEGTVRCLCQDSIDHITGGSLPEDVWIVPAVPVHVAFEWLLRRVREKGEAARLPVPGSVDAQVPNALRVPSGTVYASYATWICPDACSEPEDICSHTRQPRPGSLFEHLATVEVPAFEVVVVRSRQLAPGVGGYPSSDLQSGLERILRSPGGYLVATACRCHGVLDCLQWH